MGWLDRFRRRSRKSPLSREMVKGGPTGSTVEGSLRIDSQHLEEFIQTRKGVEGFVEPRTTVSEVTLLLVAHDGEWTRRRVESVEWAHKFANKLGVPSYDAGLVGIPQRMREYNRREKERLNQQLHRDLDNH